MTTINYIGAAIANYKSVKLIPGVNAQQPNSVVQIGLGPYLLTLAGAWDPVALANLWNSSPNPFFQQITATAQGAALILTADTLGLDFEPVCMINGTTVQVSSLQALSIVAGAGTFTLSDTNVTSGNITYSSTPDTLVNHIQTAINAMTGYGASDVAVTYNITNNDYVLDFSGGQFAGVNIPTWTANGASLTGGTAAATITRTQTGNAGTDEIVSISFPANGTHTENLDTIQEINLTGAPTSGSITLQVPTFAATAPIPITAGRSTIKRLLEDVVGQGNTIVTGGPLAQQVPGSGTTTVNGTLTDIGWGTASGSAFTNGSPMTIKDGGGVLSATDLGAVRFTLPVAPGTTIQQATITFTANVIHSGQNIGTLFNSTNNAAFPTDGASFSTWITECAAGPEDLSPQPSTTGPVTIDVTDSIRLAIAAGGWTSGQHIGFLMLVSTGAGGSITVPSAGFTLTVVCAATATYTYLPVKVEFTGALAGQNISAMTVTGSAAVTVDQVGGSQTVQNITGGAWSLVIPGYFTVPNVPYNVTATALHALITAANGGVDCSTVTGGPAPSTPLVIHFTGPLAITAINPYITLALLGSFGDAVEFLEVRAAQPTPEATNAYEMVVCPGEGTLALTQGNADVTRFFAVMTILEPNAINPAYNPTASRQVYIPLLDCNAERIEGAINEMFGKDVCRVTRTGHSLEHNQLATNENVSAVTTEAGFIHFWYYVDTFRIVFVNDYAAPETISQITVAFASVSPINSAPSDPSIWMDSVTSIPVPQNSTGDVKDMYPEYVRTYLGFTGMMAAGTPIHCLTINQYNSYVDNKLSYKGKLMSQYPLPAVQTTPSIPTGQDNNRSGLAKNLTDHVVSFQWINDIYLRDLESLSQSISNGSTQGAPWNAQPEVFQGQLETIFGVGNVLVTGSLVNSWQSESTVDIPNEEMAYQELRITLINQAAYLPYNEIGYRLQMTVTNPFGQDNDTIRCVVPYLECYTKPLPTQINNRQRIVVAPSANNDQFALGVGTNLITIARSTTAIVAQNELNALLGTMPTPGPAIWQRSVTITGTDFTQPVEIEFTGASYQFTQQQIVFGFTAASNVGLLTTTQQGVNPTQEIQVLTISGNPYGGTYTVQGSGNIAYNAIASAIQTAIGASPPVVSGTYPVFDLTWPSASGPQTLWTTTSALNNAAVIIVQTQQGGTVNGVSASVSVQDLQQGQGPLYWDNIANYNPAQVPGSDDVLIFDDATSAVQYGLDQSSIFTVSRLGANPQLRHTRLRQVFQNNQKVWLTPQGTAPAGLTLGDEYYVINQGVDYTFQLSATPGGSPIAITSVGVGPLMLCVHNLEIQIYARYAGNQIGLPNINSGVGLPEYLPRYLKVSGPTMTIGIGDGNALSMLRVDTMTEAANIQVLTSGQSLVNNIPAFLFLFDNASSAINIVDGDCGIAVYSDETSTLGPITGTGGSLLLHAVNAASVLANGLVVTEQNVQVGGMSTL